MSPNIPALRLDRCKSNDAGHALGLRQGDLLIGIGTSPAGADIARLRAAFASREPVLLTFQRGNVTWPAWVDRADLGMWGPTEIAARTIPPHRHSLRNWAIVTNVQGKTDLFSLERPLLALVLPVLWLMQQQLWTLAGTLIAALAVALPAGPWLMLAIWVGAGLHLWRSGPFYLRADRRSTGWYGKAVIAAATEADAMRLWTRLQPDARFRFSLHEPVADTVTA